MPWNEITAMDQKLLFTADYIRGQFASFKQLCERYSISRKTGYKWINRYQQLGIDGLDDQSRQPNKCPHATPYSVQKQIFELRHRFRTPLGAKKIRALLQQNNPNLVVPSVTTIYQILRRHDLVTPKSRPRSVKTFPQPFEPVRQCNDVWSVDFKGQFKLGSGKWCYPLTIMDSHSRYLLDCKAMTATTFKETQQRFIRLFKTFGLPDRVRSDNGIPFASLATGGLSAFSVWLIRLGILPERIQPGKPQQNGRHERMHRTLKRATARPAAQNFTSQQQRFDAFISEYNEQRPHEALHQKTPASIYQPSTKPYPAQVPEIEYPDYFNVHTVRSSGVVYVNNGQVYVSHLLKGERVGFEEIDDGIWDIYFGPIRLGHYNIHHQKGNTTPYWTIKV